MAEVKEYPFYQDVDGFRLPGVFSPEVFRQALRYQPLEGDVFVVTFPKSGGTWMQQILYLLYSKGRPTENPVEFWKRTSFLEALGAESVKLMTRPGAIKTHLPFHLIPYSKEAKYVHVVRNPKDALVAFYQHTRIPVVYKFQKGSFDEYFEIYLKGETDFGDYFDHLLGWYQHRNDPNVILVKFEQLKSNPAEVIVKVANFLGPEYRDMLQKDNSVLTNVLKYSSLEYMKTTFTMSIEEISHKLSAMTDDLEDTVLFSARNPKVASGSDHRQDLTDKGVAGDWRHLFSEDQNRRMNEKIDLKLKETELYSYWKSINCV